MASHSEIALVNSSGKTRSASKSGESRARKNTSANKTGRASAKKTSERSHEKQPAGTDVVPVMKLRAIDIVDEPKLVPKNDKPQDADASGGDGSPAVIRIPPSGTDTSGDAADETAAKGTPSPQPPPGSEVGVTDPELLELLEQLSATIDTANTVLDAAATVPGDNAGAPSENVAMSEPKPEPAPEPETEPQDPPPLAARVGSSVPPQADTQKSGLGFGLAANTALSGLVLAAGVAWLVHTNPWLIEGKSHPPAKSEIPASQQQVQQVKDQSSLPDKDKSVERVAVTPVAEPSFTPPPEDEPVPMETMTSQQSSPAAVADKLAKGPAGQPIALNIAVPAETDGTEISVMVQGVPDKAELSAGKRLGAGNWLLTEKQLEGLTLETGKGFKPGNYELEVILVRSDGKVPETLKVPVSVEKPGVSKPASTTAEANMAGSAAKAEKTTYVKNGVAVTVAAPPVPAAPEPEPAAITLTPQEARALLTRGDTLLREGDVAGARLLLEYAAQRGNKQAMVRLGNSYDPKYLTKLGVRGVRPDEAKAIFWYDRAAKSEAAQQTRN